MKILVTGAGGFVGTAVVDALLDTNISVVTMCRNWSNNLPSTVEQIVISDLAKCEASVSSRLIQILENVDVIIHLAARVHMMADHASDPLTEFRKVNTTATLNLARQAANAGVKRFVFISSIKVNGEDTNNGSTFSPDNKHVPTDPYGLSKYEAEQGLLVLAKETGMEVVIIRPSLVYGPGVRANFMSMMKWTHKGIPLPLGSVHNQRSLVALDNLVSFIIHCVKHPKAANEIFLISDNEDVSTTELLNKVANAFGEKAFLLPIPISLMKFVAKLVGKSDVADRLFGSLQVDSSKARELLNWKPVITMDEQLKKTADVFLTKKKLD